MINQYMYFSLNIMDSLTWMPLCSVETVSPRRIGFFFFFCHGAVNSKRI